MILQKHNPSEYMFRILKWSRCHLHMYQSFSSIIAELSKLLRCRTKNKTRIQIDQMYVDKIGEGFCK